MTKTNTKQTQTNTSTKTVKVFEDGLNALMTIEFPKYLRDDLVETTKSDLCYMLTLQIESAQWNYDFFYSTKNKYSMNRKYWMNVQEGIDRILDEDIRHDENNRLKENPLYQANLRMIEYLQERLNRLKEVYEMISGEAYKPRVKKEEAPANEWDKYITK
tara:strand:+ start:411 stop:890 length:480 start_codon:yes stop_codon:yes gene_type:complete